jgi:serine/threonine-protein kinase HipA
LARIGGDDLPGAIRVIECDPSGAPTILAEALDEDPPNELNPLKFSLAGVQLKFSVSRVGEKGLTVPARGQAGEWIAKLPDRRYGFANVPEAELAGLELARRIGIVAPRAALVEVRDIVGLPDWAVEGGGRALLIERFDRLPGQRRVHVEELAQVIGVPTGNPFAKYRSANFETIASITSALCGAEAVGEVIDRIVLNVLLGNGDAHTKNWAYRYPDGRHAVLSPVYDVVPTVAYIPEDDLGLNLAGTKVFEAVRASSFDNLAQRSGWTTVEARRRVSLAVQQVVESWNLLDDYVSKSVFRRLTERRDKLPLLRSV